MGKITEMSAVFFLRDLCISRSVKQIEDYHQETVDKETLSFKQDLFFPLLSQNSNIRPKPNISPKSSHSQRCFARILVQDNMELKQWLHLTLMGAHV